MVRKEPIRTCHKIDLSLVNFVAEFFDRPTESQLFLCDQHLEIVAAHVTCQGDSSLSQIRLRRPHLIQGCVLGERQISSGHKFLCEEHAVVPSRPGGSNRIPFVPKCWVGIQSGLDSLTTGSFDIGGGLPNNGAVVECALLQSR